VKDLGLGESVRFPGNVANDGMHALYDAADIYLNTSRVDNQPVSILEAFACGLPVVSTAVGGIPDMVTHGEDALLAPDDDPAALAGLLRALLRDGALAARLAQNGHRRMLAHSWENIYRQQGALYRAGGQ
jgi:glycosyltransferase involved in cell wall biosynthesis